jgi:anti-sigma factor RsiW
MDCLGARDLLLDSWRGRLSPSEQEGLRTHLAGCSECARRDAAEAALDGLLDHALPRRRAPSSLTARLEALVESGPTSEGRRAGPDPRRWTRLVAPALAACLAIGLLGVLLEQNAGRTEHARDVLVSEAVSDHLRSLASERGPEISSSANHEVKPWFLGRVDFAPVVPVPDVAELRLRGGSVGYFLDRKAAVVDYTIRRHAVTMLAFRPDGLELPEIRGIDGTVNIRTGGTRGFRVASWRAGGVGYALVSDVAPAELDRLARDFAAATVRTP